MVPFSLRGSLAYGGPCKDYEIYCLTVLLSSEVYRDYSYSLLPQAKGTVFVLSTKALSVIYV